MKKLFTYLSFAVVALFSAAKISAQNANRNLSNLTATKINMDLLPDSTNALNLGSKSKSWKYVFARGAYYLDGDKFISNSGTANTFIGSTAGNSNAGGYWNTATGTEALYSNITGVGNSAHGAYTLFSNTTGDHNTANGFLSLYFNSTGNYNTASGLYSLYYNTGSYNTGIGAYALEITTASQYNTAVGYNAGHNYDNGYNNVFVGANTDVTGAGYYNDIAIGQGTICTDVSQARFGNSATSSIGGYTDWTNISDGRVKKNIKQNVPGLQFINMLQPITYNLDLTAADNIIQAQRKDSTGKIIPLLNIETTARKAKEQIIYTGFIAQDVEKAAKSLNYDFSGVDAAKNDKDLYGLRYAEFVVPLVKAVQELSKMNNAKDSAIQQQNMKIDNLQQQINDLKNFITVGNNSSSLNNAQAVTISSASLQQNVPNPFTSSTTINYSIPQKYSSAKIIVTDKNGIALKQFNLSSNKGLVTINTLTLSSGAYQYTLYVDGRLIDTKQMISSK